MLQNLLLIAIIYLSLLILIDISPIQKIFVLILLYITGSLIMIILDNYYIGLTYIIIYVGAIAILFLFVIMMMNIQFYNNTYINKYLLFFIVLLILLPYMLDMISESYIYNYLNKSWAYSYIKLYDINIISIILYTGLNIYILIIGLILWTILIGILGLGKN